MKSVDQDDKGTPWREYFSAAIGELKRKDLYRSVRVLESPVSTRVRVDGRPCLLFCSNDYLGLAADDRMKRASARALEAWGTGAGASRLISGNTALYRDLEDDLRRFKKTAGARVFACGFSANIGVISSLAGEGDRVLSDALNHASIVDACRLCGAEIGIYAHGDVAHLERLLAGGRPAGRTLVVTDGVFSMDGDLAPIPEIHAACRRYGALLLVDDAHGTGVIGPGGRGTLEHLDMQRDDILQVGTFSKALGSLGGFVTGSGPAMDFILNRARSLIYSTGLPPAVLAANREAIRIVREEPERRAHLRELVSFLGRGLERLGIAVPPGPAPILPVIIGDTKETVSLSRYLMDKGIFVAPIRPPTVPEGKCRLRVSLSCRHTEEDLDQLVTALAAWGRMGS